MKLACWLERPLSSQTCLTDTLRQWKGHKISWNRICYQNTLKWWQLPLINNWLVLHCKAEKFNLCTTWQAKRCHKLQPPSVLWSSLGACISKEFHSNRIGGVYVSKSWVQLWQLSYLSWFHSSRKNVILKQELNRFLDQSQKCLFKPDWNISIEKWFELVSFIIR